MDGPPAALITAGRRGDSPHFIPVLDAVRVPRTGPGRLRSRPDRVLADKAYSSRANRAYLRRRKIAATIPSRSTSRRTGEPWAHPVVAHRRSTPRSTVSATAGLADTACAAARSRAAPPRRRR